MTVSRQLISELDQFADLGLSFRFRSSLRLLTIIIDYNHPEVKADVIQWADWVVKEIGFKGFRFVIKLFVALTFNNCFRLKSGGTRFSTIRTHCSPCCCSFVA